MSEVAIDRAIAEPRITNEAHAAEPAAITSPTYRKAPLADNDPTRDVTPARAAAALLAIAGGVLALALLVGALVAMLL